MSSFPSKGVAMLVLSRQRDQSIIIGEDIELTIVDIRGDKVRLGITAPRDVAVHRKEVYMAIKEENEKAAQLQPGDLSGVAGKVIEPAAGTHMKIAKRTIRLAVLASGGGTTLQNLIDLIREEKLDAEIGVVVASNPTSAAITRAEAVGIKTVVVDRKQVTDLDEFSRQVF